MTNPITTLFAKFGADTKDFEQGIKQVKAGMKQTQGEVEKSKASLKGFNDTLKMVAAGMVAIGAVSAVKYGLELDKLGRQSLRLKKEFANLAEQHDMSVNGILSALRKASGGTVKEMDLMLEANRAMKYGLVSTEEEFKNLMLAARFYGRQMGVDTLEAYQRMVNGIGKGSRQIIDDLGITGISFEQGADKAEVMGQVVSQAMAEIAASGGMIDDAADNVARMNAQLEDMKQNLAELAVKSGVVDVGVNFVTKGTAGWINTFEAMETIDEWAAKNEKKVIDVVITETLNLGAKSLVDWLNYHGDKVFRPNFAAENEWATQQRDLAAQRWEGLGQAIQQAGIAARMLPPDSQIPSWTQGPDDYSAAFGFSQEADLEVRNALIKSDLKINEERTKNAKKYWDEYKAKGEEALNAIKSLIGSAFTSTEDWIRVALQGTSADVGDAWDEMARRAEAVINDMFDAEGKQKPGATSPWLSMFDVPEDVLRQGGDTLKAFMTKLAADIRESPTVQELGTVGIDAMVANIKTELMNQIGKAELDQTVALKLATDPEAVALMQQLGIDVSAAVGALQDPIVTSLEDLKTTTLGTEVKNFPNLLTEDTAETKLEAVRSEVAGLTDHTLRVEITNFNDMKMRDLMMFGNGGLVPGLNGQAQLAMVHGGEYVIPANQVQNIYQLTVNSRSERSVIQEFNIMRSLAGA